MSDGIDGWRHAGKPVDYPEVGAKQDLKKNDGKKNDD
jgi:hypothetical protein